MVAEARRAGMIGQEEAASLTVVRNIRQKGTRLRNANPRAGQRAAGGSQSLHPEREVGLRDPGFIRRLPSATERTGRARRRDIQQREGRWVLADLEGEGRRIRTVVAILIWVKQGTKTRMTAVGIEDGQLLRSVSKSGKINRDTLSDWQYGR
jgi:hypothetical protein